MSYEKAKQNGTTKIKTKKCNPVLNLLTTFKIKRSLVQTNGEELTKMNLKFFKILFMNSDSISNKLDWKIIQVHVIFQKEDT